MTAPREWPPVSVWLLGPALSGPWAALAVGEWRAGYDRWQTAAVVAGLCLSAASVLAVWPSWWGWGAAAMTTGIHLATLLIALPAVVEYPPATARQYLIPAGLAVGVLTQASLLWWPATRRWCGLLPPAESDDD